MTDDERSPDELALEEFGLPPRDEDLPAIRAQLVAETTREAAGDARENATLALCVQLFAAGHVEDSLLVWRAKRASYDAGFRIDVQLLCGAGVEVTLRFLRDKQPKAVAYIEKCVAAGDFEGDRLAQMVPFYRRYYGLDSWIDALRRGVVLFGEREVALGASREEVADLAPTPVLGFATQPVKLTYEDGSRAHRMYGPEPAQANGWLGRLRRGDRLRKLQGGCRALRGAPRLAHSIVGHDSNVGHRRARGLRGLRATHAVGRYLRNQNAPRTS